MAVHSDQAQVAEVPAEARRQTSNSDTGAGYTALHAAVIRGNANVAKALLATARRRRSGRPRAVPSKRYSGFALDKR
jgi:hypothetical protein